MADRLERNARTVTLLTLVSRCTGLARDAVLSRAFGIGPVMDAFALAFMVPNLFRRLFGEGALSAALLPVYTRLQREEPAAARQLVTLVVAGLLVLLGAITLVGEGLLLGWMAWRDGAGETAGLGPRLIMITLPYMPLVCLVAILGAVLQVHGRFGPTAAAPILLNLGIVAATLFVPLASPGITAPAHITVVAASILVAGVLQVTWSAVALRRAGVRLHRPDARSRRPLRTVLGQALPMILGLGVLQLNTFIDGLIASYPTTIGPTVFGVEYPLRAGALATLGYAQRLYEFPLGVFGIAVATAIFPLLAQHTEDPARYRSIVRRGLRLVVFIGLPASAGLLLVGVPATAVILQGGDFNAADTRRVAFVLTGYAPAIWAYSMNHVLTRGLYAIGDARTPVRISISIVGLNLLLNVTLIWTPLREAGLAWSTAICAVIQTALLARALQSRVGPIIDRSVARSWLRTAGATLVMAAVVAPLVRWMSIEDAGWWRTLLTLSVAIVAGGMVMVGSAAFLRMPELRWALGARSTPDE